MSAENMQSLIHRFIARVAGAADPQLLSELLALPDWSDPASVTHWLLWMAVAVLGACTEAEPFDCGRSAWED
ncbi:hypothetical protein GCM10023351_01080 [Microbacterium gilvum]|uniref:Uncharacterized protein n=1 Tax=Microbacterium gilvum TaxID=1336204 RepID=A0ABP8ZQE4_9MICO